MPYLCCIGWVSYKCLFFYIFFPGVLELSLFKLFNNSFVPDGLILNNPAVILVRNLNSILKCKKYDKYPSRFTSK